MVCLRIAEDLAWSHFHAKHFYSVAEHSRTVLVQPWTHGSGLSRALVAETPIFVEMLWVGQLYILAGCTYVP
jgi:hypothetical protein